MSPQNRKHVDLGAQLVKARRLRGWSQLQLEVRSGVPQNAILRYEKGLHEPRLPVLIALGKALGVPANILMRDAMRAAGLETRLAPEPKHVLEAKS